MKCKLSDICDFRKGKVEVANLNTKSYISTENMLSNKSGITDASSLPTVSLTQEYKSGDVLVSNIRPYFKKIWQARYDGGCSNDVLVFVPKSNTDSNFLYYVLADDDFFTYSMATSKGTKMPRGDKTSIMQYAVPMVDFYTQKKIASVLKSLDEKIELNNAINENLEQQIEAIFNNKYAPSLCSPNWVVGTIGDVVTLQRGYDLPKDKMVSGSYPVAGSTDTIFYHNEYTTEAPCVVMGRSGNIGKPRLYMERCWAHNTTLFVKDFKGNNPYWSYYMLRSIDYSQFRGGSAVPTLNRNHVHSFEISIPPVSQQNEFAEIILPLLLLIENNRKEIKRLSTIREALLPKLMAGELDVSSIDL